jgi:hypothetical protein
LTERIYFLAAQYVGLRRYTAFYQVRPRPDIGAKCAVLVALPWSEYSKRPFRYPKAEPLLEQASQGRFVAAVVGLGVLIVLLRLGFYAGHGFLEEEHDAAAACAGSFVAAIVLNAVCWWVSGWGLSNIHKLTEFYTFYDALPKIGGYLRPLTWAEASKVFGGPPHPNVLTVDFRLFYALLALSTLAWIGGWSEQIATGRRMRTLPDHFNDLADQAASEGRLPTPDEFMRVIAQAAATMDTHELEAFKRSMTKRIGNDERPQQ